tara:strand:- start:242 stop:718 length:477 start_codon:yes stop_codon:yes gene_type:complete
MAKSTKNDVSRQPREAQSREHSSARKPWAPPSALDAPNPPEGYLHRWVRTEVRGYDDRKNMSARLREGWEPVRADEYPDFESPSLDEGRYAGVIGVGGLILCRIPKETVDERSEYFKAKTRDQMLSVDNDLMKEEHQAMPINKNRQSRVTFGGTQSKD